jgi:alpha-beta hydrolase superfamily lysophospholipase
MRDRSERLRNEVEHPERYQEVTITSAGVPIMLSVGHRRSDGPVVVFLPGTMTHPLLYEEFCDGLAAHGITVVGVHPEGHGKSPRVGRVLRLENLVTNALDATAWARVLPCGRGLQSRQRAGDDRRDPRPPTRRRHCPQHPRASPIAASFAASETVSSTA